MDFAVTLCHNHAYSYKRPSNRDIAGIFTHVDGCCFAIISDFCASIIESGTVIYHRLSKKKAETPSRVSAFFIYIIGVPSEDVALIFPFVEVLYNSLRSC